MAAHLSHLEQNKLMLKKDVVTCPLFCGSRHHLGFVKCWHHDQQFVILWWGFFYGVCVCVASPLTLRINRKIQVFDSAAEHCWVQFSHHCCGAEWPQCLERWPSVSVTML